MTDTRVTVDNFVRVETERMFAALMSADGLATNEWIHHRVPAPLEKQPIIRQNRDTLYSAVIVDISEGATLTLPDTAGRYISAMVVNQDHYINDVFHEPGEHALTVATFETPFVLVGVRILADPNDPDDIAIANGLQDQLGLAANAAAPFHTLPYDQTSFAETREALLTLSKGLRGYTGSFGSRREVEPVQHLLGTASGWGGLPEREAFYQNVNPGLPVGEYTLTIRDVPVDGFWSVSLYTPEGYFPTDTGGRVSINNLTAQRDPDGSVTIHFGGEDGLPNLLPIFDGWNYLVRYYRPRPEVIDGTWTLPEPTPVS